MNSPSLQTSSFKPNWVSVPGDTISDVLRERGVKKTNTVDEKIEQCMDFFGVSNLDAWANKYHHRKSLALMSAGFVSIFPLS